MHRIIWRVTGRAYRQAGRYLVLALVAMILYLAGFSTSTTALGGTVEPTMAATAVALAYSILAGHTSGVTVLAWSPDGERLASATGGFSNFDSTYDSVRLWARTGAPVAVLRGHAGAVSSLAWSPNGKLLASGASDATIRL